MRTKRHRQRHRSHFSVANLSSHMCFRVNHEKRNNNNLRRSPNRTYLKTTNETKYWRYGRNGINREHILAETERTKDDEISARSFSNLALPSSVIAYDCIRTFAVGNRDFIIVQKVLN